MREKKFPVEVGNFKEKRAGFLEYISDQGGQITVRVQRGGYHKNSTIKNTVDSFLQGFYKYFSDDVTGKVSIYTIRLSRAEPPKFYVERARSIIANLLWKDLKTEEKFITALSGIIAPEIGDPLYGIPSLDKLEPVFKKDFFEKLKPSIMAKGLKES